MLIGNGGHAKVIKSFWSGSDCIIAVGDNAARKREAIEHKGLKFGIAIHPTAWVDSDTAIGEGAVIMAGVIVQPGCKIGKHVILNSGCVVDHDCIIGDYAHIAPGATLCGNVTVGEGALVGVNACAVPGAVIEPWSLVKAGSVAVKCVHEWSTRGPYAEPGRCQKCGVEP